MAGISNFNVTGKYTYYDGSEWHTDEIDCMQFASKDIYRGLDLCYKKEAETMYKVTNEFTQKVYDYYPGLIYKPKKYYNFTDIFYKREHMENIRETLKNAFNSYTNSEVIGYINGTEDSIITIKKDDFYIFPSIRYSFTASSGLTLRRMGNVNFSLIKSKFPPSQTRYRYSEGKTWKEVCDNGTWREATNEELPNIPGSNQLYSLLMIYDGEYDTYSKWCILVDKYIDEVLRLKYYIAASANTGNFNSYTYNGIEYGETTACNYTRYLYIWLLSDPSKTSIFANSCFSESKFYLYYHGSQNYLTDVAVSTKSSPEPTSNPEDDDPNDDDPGSQGGGGDGDKGGDGDHDDSSDVIPEDPVPPIGGSSNGLISVWNPSPSQLESLANKLWNPDAWEAIKQYFTNPMESILSLSIIPVAPKTTSGTIHLGGYDTEISAGRVLNDYIIFDCGSISINRYYGSYLDYAPFTKISCTLPYIGEVDIDPDQVMQKILSVKYHINVVTGECIGYLLADGSVFATYSGNCTKQLPLCQTDYSSIISGAVQICSTLVSAGVAAGVGGTSPKSLFDATAESTKASNSLVSASSSLLGTVMGMKPSYKHASQLGTGAGQLGPQTPFLTIIRPNLDLADNYKAYTGYPCNKNLDLSSLHGFTVAEACNLSIPSASLEEISEIKELLLQGVIL